MGDGVHNDNFSDIEDFVDGSDDVFTIGESSTSSITTESESNDDLHQDIAELAEIFLDSDDESVPEFVF